MPMISSAKSSEKSNERESPPEYVGTPFVIRSAPSYTGLSMLYMKVESSLDFNLNTLMFWIMFRWLSSAYEVVSLAAVKWNWITLGLSPTSIVSITGTTVNALLLVVSPNVASRRAPTVIREELYAERLSE